MTNKSCPVTILAAFFVICSASAPAYAKDQGVFLYGQFNYGLLRFDDGTIDKNYFVDSDASSSRVGLDIVMPDDPDGQLRFKFETSIGSKVSSSFSQLDDKFGWDYDVTKIRKAEAVYETSTTGIFYFGQGSMASDGALESDLSGTGVIATVSVADAAGGQLFRRADDTLSGIAFGEVTSSFDGSRRLRIRYDTPNLLAASDENNYLTLTAAVGREVLRDDDRTYADAAFYFGRNFSTLVWKTSGGWNWRDESDGFGGVSTSLLHNPTGLSGTLAAGISESDARYVYGKLGWEASLFGSDKHTTALSVDYYAGSDFGSGGSDTRSWSVALVQNFGRNFQAYAAYRRQEYEHDAASYKEGEGFIVGARLKYRFGLTGPTNSK